MLGFCEFDMAHLSKAFMHTYT